MIQTETRDNETTLPSFFSNVKKSKKKIINLSVFNTFINKYFSYELIELRNIKNKTKIQRKYTKQESVLRNILNKKVYCVNIQNKKVFCENIQNKKVYCVIY